MKRSSDISDRASPGFLSSESSEGDGDKAAGGLNTDNTMMRSLICIVLFLAKSLRTEIEDIHIKNLIVPLNPQVGQSADKIGAQNANYFQVGENVDLVCDYELAGEEIYSVKWYKDGLEIFR